MQILPTIVGRDHVDVAMRSLGTVADHRTRLGFMVSPSGFHSPHMGSGNDTIMFGEDYIALLGVVAPQPQNVATGAAALRERGLAAVGPVKFGRPVPVPTGGERETRFSVFH